MNIKIHNLVPGTNPEAAWQTIASAMETAVSLYCTKDYVDGNLEFHKLSFIASANAGFTRFRYIQVGDGMIGLGTSGKELEHWFFIGALFNCCTELPCSSSQFKAALPYLPCSQTAMLSPRLQELCELTPYEDGGLFELPDTLEAYIKKAPYKQRGDWGRLLRKAEGAGLRVVHSIDWEAVARITPGYLDYWSEKHDSYVDETVMVTSYLEMFKEFESYSMGITLYLGDTPVAVNMAWVKDGVVHDMLCVRNMSPEYKSHNFGVVSILLNVKAAIERGLTHYSLSSGDQNYKKQFMYGQPSRYSCVNVLSELDVVLRNGQDGYVNGVYLTKSQVLQLADTVSAERLEEIRVEHPFITDAIASNKADEALAKAKEEANV